MEHIKCEYLGGGISVFCSETHRFGTDAVMLEHFAASNAKINQNCKIIDLGCGCGIIPMLFARDFSVNISALDIQTDAIALTERAVEYNNLKNRVTPICTNLNNITSLSEYNSAFSLVTMNPPYKRKNSGLMTENNGLNIARFEIECDFDDIAKAAKYLLKPQGMFCVCNRPNRLCDMMVSLRKNGIEPKIMQSVKQRQNDKPQLVLLAGVLGGGYDIDILPDMVIENEDGSLSNECAKMYEKWEYERKNNKGETNFE